MEFIVILNFGGSNLDSCELTTQNLGLMGRFDTNRHPIPYTPREKARVRVYMKHKARVHRNRCRINMSFKISLQACLGKLPKFIHVCVILYY